MKEKDLGYIIHAVPLTVHSGIASHRTQCTESPHKQAFVKEAELTVTCRIPCIFCSWPGTADCNQHRSEGRQINLHWGNTDATADMSFLQYYTETTYFSAFVL